MASRTGQSELRRRVPFAFLVSLILGVCLAAGTGRSWAQYQPSGYQPSPGEPFFLLSDKSYGTDEPALVRLELASRDFGMKGVAANGGVDIALYRVPSPLRFLERQKNLRRVRVDAVVAEEGGGNAVAHLWDRWVQSSREAWRSIFSSGARRAVTQQAPDLATSPTLHAPTRFDPVPQFAPLKGFELVQRFRYPVHAAKPIMPPKEVALAGSSSEFIAPTEGNVMIPLGRLAPGLYVVEAFVGSYRATTVVFVSDTVAITKTASQEMLVWAANRRNGTAVRNVAVTWTDGVGKLAGGNTDRQGVARLSKESPERSFVYGMDPAGGVFISENFYYDSEIYDTKIYAVTDRPLYRPGDEVFVKFVGREFRSARDSIPVVAGEIAVTVMDPNGAPLASQKLRLTPEDGGDTSFRLPENASAGGYELRFDYRGTGYSAAFRVADYQKPHFEITLVPDKADFRAGEAVTGRLQLHYPDGKPVVGADIALSVRAQQLTMLDGELRYHGQFPVKVTTDALKSDAKGEARFELPAAAEPSRYILTALATDGAAYRVKVTKELLIENSRSVVRLDAEPRFSPPGTAVKFKVTASTEGGVRPAQWEWIRLEDRKRETGAFTSVEALTLTFAEPGSYTVQLRDARGNLLGGTSHWVSGGSIRAPAGSIEIVSSRNQYRAGETAELLVTFPEPVDEALLTLERDRVERTALLGGSETWLRPERVTPTQWRIKVPVTQELAPNITFSVAAVRNGDYVFQNHGIQVLQPRIDLAFKTAKTVYAPGDRVDVELTATLEGRPVVGMVAVGVVDEMIYVLQPEIAPDIQDFFFHPRRNNVRTASSLSFISYDLSASRNQGAPEARTMQQRRVKVLERPRRDEIDTAYWNGRLKTDANGRATFSFVMPDALTRWRITGRAFDRDGMVGQKAAWIRADKPLYAKWTSPQWARRGDAPIASIAVFNQTGKPQTAELIVEGMAGKRSSPLQLQPGANFVTQPLRGIGDDVGLRITIAQTGKAVDVLDTRFRQLPAAWTSAHSLAVPLVQGRAALTLPADARNIRVRFTNSYRAQFERIVDDLLDYPYGCVEQTASRMIPNALALRVLDVPDRRVADRLRQRLNGHRLRLAYMAGDKGVFTWWGRDTAGDPWLTPYAWYADWIASRAVGAELPKEHWSRLLEVYASGGHALPPVQRGLVLHWMQEMGLPVGELVSAYFDTLATMSSGAEATRPGAAPAETSTVLAMSSSAVSQALAVAMADRLAQRGSLTLPAAVAAQREAAYRTLTAVGPTAAKALMIANGRLPVSEAENVLAAVRAEMPTLERAMALLWVDGALQGKAGGAVADPKLEAPWIAQAGATGSRSWRWTATDKLPRDLRLTGKDVAATTAIVQFDSATKVSQELGVKISRRLYRVSKGDAETFALEPLDDAAKLTTGDLYLDEVVLSPTGPRVRYAIAEIALPPGASVEESTWGIQIPSVGGDMGPLPRARHESMPFGYVVPIEPLEGTVTLRHLVRFAQKGRFQIPPARLYRMYVPGQKAYESAGVRRWEVQ